jgi:hypothetical protein
VPQVQPASQPIHPQTRAPVQQPYQGEVLSANHQPPPDTRRNSYEWRDKPVASIEHDDRRLPTLPVNALPRVARLGTPERSDKLNERPRPDVVDLISPVRPGRGTRSSPMVLDKSLDQALAPSTPHGGTVNSRHYTSSLQHVVGQPGSAYDGPPHEPIPYDPNQPLMPASRPAVYQQPVTARAQTLRGGYQYPAHITASTQPTSQYMPAPREAHQAQHQFTYLSPQPVHGAPAPVQQAPLHAPPQDYISSIPISNGSPYSAVPVAMNQGSIPNGSYAGPYSARPAPQYVPTNGAPAPAQYYHHPR